MYTQISSDVASAPSRFTGELMNSLKWANDQLTGLQAFSNPIANSIAARGSTLQGWANEDRQRWKDVYQPLQDRIISDANAWDSAANREAVRGAAVANVAQKMDAADAAAARQLEGFGAKPTDVSYAALNRGAKLARATAGAAASDVADRARVLEGVGLRTNAAQMGANLPGQALAESGAATGAEVAATGVKNAPTGMFVGSLGNPLGWAGALTGANNALSGAQSVANSGQRAQAQMDESSGGGGIGSVLGMLGGTALGAFGGPALSKVGGMAGNWLGGQLGFEDGGEVPDDMDDTVPAVSATGGGGFVDPSMSPSGGAETDDVPAAAPTGPARLNANEFVMPERATKYYGTKFFTDLIAKADKAMGMEPQPVGPEMGEFARGGRVPQSFTKFRPAQIPPPQRTRMRATGRA